MKQFISILAFSLFAVSAHAALPNVPQAPLCEINADPAPVQPNLEVTQEVDVKQATSVSPVVLSYINQHLQLEQYTTTDLTFAEVQKFFTVDQAYNDLYVISYKVKSSGATFTEVKSYPGDNPYSLYFDANGKVVARAQDGDVGLIIGDKTVYCWSAAE